MSQTKNKSYKVTTIDFTRMSHYVYNMSLITYFVDPDINIICSSNFDKLKIFSK